MCVIKEKNHSTMQSHKHTLRILNICYIIFRIYKTIFILNKTVRTRLKYSVSGNTAAEAFTLTGQKQEMAS